MQPARTLGGGRLPWANDRRRAGAGAARPGRRARRRDRRDPAPGARVVGYLRTLFHEEADVADAFSAWAEHLWKGLPAFQGRAAFRTWALRLAFNAALDVRDRAHPRRERRLRTGEASVLAEEVRTNSVAARERHRQQLAALRQELSPDEQTLLFLRLDQELPWDDVGMAWNQL